MIAVVLEMCGIPSLAFAVGVYLPLSSSSPIFIGGAGALAGGSPSRATGSTGRDLTEAELIAETDKSPGVLVASGYIAGGAIAGIGIAFMAGALGGFDQRIDRRDDGAQSVLLRTLVRPPGAHSVRRAGGGALSLGRLAPGPEAAGPGDLMRS